MIFVFDIVGTGLTQTQQIEFVIVVGGITGAFAVLGAIIHKRKYHKNKKHSKKQKREMEDKK